jgi:hypothetical protein
MRASDRSRERAAALLRRRCEEGYLSLETFERRVERSARVQRGEQVLLGGCTVLLL